MIKNHASRRRFQRHVLSAPLEIVRKPPYGAAPLPGLTMEIAAGGFSALVSDELKVGETVTAKILLASNNILSEAVVRNKHLFRYGFEFVGLTEQVRTKINEVCKILPAYEGGWH